MGEKDIRKFSVYLFVLAFLFCSIVAVADAADTIIDNRDAATSRVGSWYVSSGSGSIGVDSVFARKDTSVVPTFTWHFTPSQSGEYEVSMWWTYRDSRSTSVPIDIEYSGGTERVVVNQKLNGSTWNALGTPHFFESGKTYRVTITAQPIPTSASTTCADAVKFTPVVTQSYTVSASAGSGGSISPSGNVSVPAGADQTFTITANPGYHVAGVLVDGGSVGAVPSYTFPDVDSDHTIAATFAVDTPTQETIVDNRDAATSRVGTWAVSSGSGSIGVDSVFARKNTTVTPTFTWNFTPSQSGNCAVSMWWTYRDTRSTGVPIDIEYSGGTERVVVNQKLNGSTWNLLGTYAFEVGVNYRVTITAQAIPTSSSTTCADAVKFACLGGGTGNTLPVAVIDSISPNPAQTGQTVTFIGHGTDSDGSIKAYEWRSSIGGLLSTLNTFITSSLASGSHTISFRVQDNNDAWSTPVTRILAVGVPVNQPPTAIIDSISPNPAQTGQTVTFTGHGTDIDGNITGFSWRSGSGSILSTQTSFSTSALPAGTHVIYFKVQDNGNAWSQEVSRTLQISGQTSNTEHVYVGALFDSKNAYFIEVLRNMGATQQGAEWRYINTTNGKTYIVHFLYSLDDTRLAMYSEDSVIIIQGHSNYGLGGVYSTSEEASQDTIYDLYYMDDIRLLNWSSPWVPMNVKSCIETHAFPNWWPVFQDGTSAVMPYVHGDPQGDPPYNYYITYQVPGDPTHYRIETARNSALQRFPDSGKPAWYSSSGTPPSPSNSAHLQYYITNTDTSPVTRLCGTRICPRPHYGSKTIVFRKENDIDKSKLKYKKMIYVACSTGIYYLNTFQHGIMFYSVASGGLDPAYTFLKAYLEGKSDHEIWELIQDVEPKYDYYDFSKRPSEQ